MPETSLIDRQRTLLRDLLRYAAERARAEEALGTALRSEQQAAQADYDQASRALNARFAADKEAADGAIRQARADIEARFEADKEAARQQYRDAWGAFKAQHRADREAARTNFQEARWAAEAIHEGCKNESESYLREHQAQVYERKAKLTALRNQMRDLLEEWNQPTDFLYQAPAPGESVNAAGPKLPQVIARAEALVEDLRELIAPRRHEQRRLVGMFSLLALALVVPLGWLAVWLFGLPLSLWTVFQAGARLGAAVALAVGCGTYLALLHMSRARVRAPARPLGQLLAEGEARCQLLLKNFAAQCERQIRASRRRERAGVRRAHAAFRQRWEELR